MQGVENDIGLQFGEDLSQIAARIYARDLADLPLQRVSATRARRQRHLALGRDAAHQDSDMKFGQGL